MLYNHYYDVNDICEDNDNYNNINNYCIKPFASKKEYFDGDSFSLFKASRISHFKNNNFWAIMGEEEGQFQTEEVEEENETPENPFTPSYSDFEPSPLPNFRNLEIIPQQPPKRENIIQYDRNTTTDRMRFTESPLMHFNSDFQSLHPPNLNNSEVMLLQPPKQENIIQYDRNTTTDRMGHTEIPFTQHNSDFQPSPLLNLKNSKVISQQPPKQENIIQFDRNTITDRMPLTEMPIIHFNRDFQPSPLPNLNNSEVMPQQPPKRENNITYDRNTTTDRTKTQQMVQTKNMGAKPKGYVNISGEKMHTRDADDNIYAKIRRALNNHSKKWFNKILKKSDNPVLKSLTLLKVQNSVILVHKKEDNLEFLEMNLVELFSNPISAKFKNYKKDHNINTIEKILKVGDKEINDILKTDIETILNVYNHKIKNKLFEDFPTIDVDIAKFKDHGLDDNYIKEYIYYAEHFNEEIGKKFPRKRRKKI